MTLEQFRDSLTDPVPPSSLPILLAALWWDANGGWDRAHELAQSEGDRHNSRDAAWVHAYLHRKGGDASNAAYWYRQAARPIPNSTHEEEWRQIAAALLEQPLSG